MATENKENNRRLPEIQEERITKREIAIPKESDSSNHFIQVLDTIRHLYQKIGKEKGEESTDEHPENSDATYYEVIIQENIEDINQDKLKRLEYILTELHSIKETNMITKGKTMTEKINTSSFITPDFIRFAADFGERCDISTSLWNNFAYLFKGITIENDENLIETFFNTVFFQIFPSVVTFYTVSSFSGFERKGRMNYVHIKYIKKRLLAQYMTSVLNRFKNKGGLETEVDIADMDEICKRIDSKINALNGCIYKGALSQMNVDKFVYSFVILQMNSDKYSFMDNYTEAVLFYLLLIYVSKCGGSRGKANAEKRNNIKMLLLIELKWELKDVDGNYVTYEEVAAEFQRDYKHILGSVKKVKHAFHNPKYTLCFSEAAKQVIKTKEGGTIYVHKSPKKSTVGDTPVRNGISPYSGRITSVNQEETALPKKKLDFE